MSENLRQYLVAVFGLDHVMRLVPESAWDRPSPCENWTARQVAGHAIGVVNNVAAKVGLGDAVDPFGDVAAIAGDNPAATFRSIRNRLLEALDREGVELIDVQSSLGEMKMDEYLAGMTIDAVVHTWDIARAAGVDDTLDPDLVEAVHARLVANDGASLRTPRRYGDEVEVGDDASAQDRMIAFSGRDPGFRV